MKPLKFVIGPDGKQKVVSMKPEEAAKYQTGESEFCGLCGGSGMVEEHRYCSCSKGKEMQRADSNLPKTTTPPAPHPDQLSAFSNKGHHGWQLNIPFKDSEEE